VQYTIRFFIFTSTDACSFRREYAAQRPLVGYSCPAFR